MNTEAKFKNAKACFSENIERLPSPPQAGRDLNVALQWNLNRGLLDLTVAIESRLEELESRISSLEQSLQRRK
jgi:hypothetical protein